MASMQQVPPERHFGFQCRNCAVVNFAGRRYSCGVCPEYNLCGDCYDANLMPELPYHLYYHPLKVYYTRAAFQLYFEGEAETYSTDNPSLQSYKCALCNARGLTSAALRKHLVERHRSHSDYEDYVELVDAYTQTERLITPAAALPQDEELLLREARAMVDFLLPSEPTGRTTQSQSQSRRGFSEDSLSLAQLLVHLKMLNLTAPEFPIRCVDILKRAHSLQAQQSGQDVVKTAEKYVNLIEHEVAAGLCERRLRLGRTSVRLVQRNGAMIIVPVSNVTPAVRTPATPSATSRTLFLNGLRGLDSLLGNEDSALPGTGVGSGKYRQALVSSKPPKVSQDTEDHQVQNKASDKKRFLCSQFLVDNKPANCSREASRNTQQKSNFVEAILCSMLADEELSPLQFKPFSVDAIKSLERRKKLAVASWKPQAGKKILPIQQPYMNDMIRFYKALDKYKNNMENRNVNPSKAVAKNSAKCNDQSSIMGAPSDSNGEGDASEIQGNEIEEPASSDSELLELTMARIIQGIDAIIDEDNDL